MPSPRPHRFRPRMIIAAVIMIIALAACTADPPDWPTPSAGTTRGPAAPANAFPALAGRDATGARVFTAGLAGLGNQVVSVGFYWDGRLSATFGRSDDGGQTWQAARAPAPGKPVAERADHVVVHPHPTGATWLALGSSGESFARWTSSDGVVWDRQTIDRADIDYTDDNIVDLVSTDQGFAAAGYVTDDRGDRRPRLWTSADGSDWVTHRLPGSGTATSVAARGRTWVVVGEDDDNWRIWRSTDAGARWTVITSIPRPPDDAEFARGLADVVVHQAEYVAIGSYFTDDVGDGTNGYLPMTYRSRDGKTWRFDRRSVDLGGHGEGFGQSLVSAGAELNAVVELNQTLDRQEIWHSTDGRWTPIYDPRPDQDKAVWQVGAPVRTDSGWVTAANRTLNSSVTTTTWHLKPGSLLFETVDPPPAPRATPLTVPTKLVRWGGSWRVTGDTRDRRGIWTQASDGSFGPPQETTLDAGASIRGLVADNRSMLAFGSTTGGNSDFATVWRSADGQTYTPTGRNTFEKVQLYSYSEIADLKKFGSTWFAVGERSSNADANVSALVATSTDGKLWEPGRAARVITKAKGDVWYDVTDLAGDHERRRRMTDVTRTSRDFLAAGSSEENGPEQATVWHSADGRTWRLRVIGARGFQRSQVDNAVSRGNRTVLSGWVGRKGQTETTPYVWSSVDGGRTWSGRVVGGLGDTAGGLVTTESHFVLESSTNGDLSKPVVQRSSDGRTWNPLELSGFAAGPDDDVWLSDLEADGRDIVALVRVANPVGVGSVLVRQTVG